LLIVILTTQICYAQKSEVAARIGAGSLYELIRIFETNTLLNSTPDAVTVGGSKGILPISLQYRAAADRFFSYSMEAQYMSVVQDVENLNTKENIGVLITRFYTIMPGFQMNFLDNDVFGLSSGASLGIGLRTKTFDKVQTSESESSNVLAAQVDLLKLRFGKKFNVFTDIGFGTRSLITLGVGYRF
jgi:hypothetical protein